MTGALAREVTCTDCGSTFAGRVGGSRRCGPCAQSRVAAAVRARRTEDSPVVEAVSSLPAPVVEPVAPETPSVPSVLPEPTARTVLLAEDAARTITCADCGTVFVRTNWGGATPTRCKPCQKEAARTVAAERREAARAEREATRVTTPGVPRGGVSPTVERAAATLAHRMQTVDPACAGDDRFTADAPDLPPGAVDLMTRLCRGCPLFEPCALVAKTSKPAAGFWAGKHYTARTRPDAQELTA